LQELFHPPERFIFSRRSERKTHLGFLVHPAKGVPPCWPIRQGKGYAIAHGHLRQRG